MLTHTRLSKLLQAVPLHLTQSIRNQKSNVNGLPSANTTKEAVWLRTLLQELDLSQKKTTIIHTDNQRSIALAHNPVSHFRAKHIDVRGQPEIAQITWQGSYHLVFPWILGVCGLQFPSLQFGSPSKYYIAISGSVVIIVLISVAIVTSAQTRLVQYK